MKVIAIDSLNNGIFSFVSFSSQPVMLMGRETPYISEMCHRTSQRLTIDIALVDADPESVLSNPNFHEIPRRAILLQRLTLFANDQLRDDNI
jgi:hypothetical protein